MKELRSIFAERGLGLERLPACLFSCCSDDEGAVKVRPDDEGSECVVLAHLVLLRVDLLGQQLVEVDFLLARRGLGPHSLNIQFALQSVVEAHDHVKAVPVSNLKDKQVLGGGACAHGERAPQNALVVQVRLVNDFLDVFSLLVHGLGDRRSVSLDKEFQRHRWLAV